nr:embryogenesis-associated protein EMB8-like [Ipomoea trifida]
MDCIESSIAETPAVAYSLLFKAVVSIPTQHYLLGLAFLCAVFLYNFLEFHFLEDLLSGFRGSPVSLTYNPCSEFYHGVVSKCQIIHGRQMFNASDGGTFALDWVLNSDVSGNATDKNIGISKDDTTPIVVVIPGLTSDSASPYLKHLAFNTAKCGWNVVVSNHRGLGGVSVTSDAFYNAGWTEDIRTVLKYLHKEYPKAPIFVVGTSIGANILVKYLGEDGDNVPVAGAVAVCSPWDLLIGSRFISRKLVQRLYDRALTIGLQGYAQMHCSSAPLVGLVSVPLLCISTLDDPVCTAEAIPWDECRANKNIVLAVTKHGGHLAFFEGITASGLWWVRAVNEFIGVLHSSPLMHKSKQVESSEGLHSPSSIDQGPYISVADGMVAAMNNEQPTFENITEETQQTNIKGPDAETSDDSSSKTAFLKRCLHYLGQQSKSRKSIWLLVYVALVSGSALSFLFKRRTKKILAAKPPRNDTTFSNIYVPVCTWP